MKRLAISVIKEFLISLLVDSRVIAYIHEKLVAVLNKGKRRKNRSKNEQAGTDTQGKC